MTAIADKFRFFGFAGRLAGGVILAAAVAAAAVAQNVVVIVNGEPITAIDIELRSKFLQLSTQKTPARQDVINDLIDEKLKIKEGKRWGIEVSDSDVDAMFANMSSRMRLTANS
jgi:peptidyl-prolyl cis-trans isomerase SurA